MFFDIGMGLLLAAVFGAVTDLPFSWMLVGVGVAGALWPDIDFLVWCVRGKKLDHLTHKHRDLLHKPIIVGIPVIAVFNLLMGPEATWLFGSATITHFIHDTIGHGWGIKWLYPFDDRYFVHRRIGEMSARWWGLSPDQQANACEMHGDRQWAKNAYGRMSLSLVLEVAMLLCGIVATLLWRYAY